MRRVEYMRQQREMRQRRSFFGRRRVQILLTLGVLLLAVSVVIGSGASFTSQSANPGNVFTAGNLKHTNSKNGEAILTAEKMKPGDIVTGSVTLENNGDIPGVFTLTKEVTASSPGLGGGYFDNKLDLTITEGATTVWSGKIGADMEPVSLGTWDVDKSHTYDFTVTFPDGGKGADNDYKKASITVAFNWEAESVPTP